MDNIVIYTNKETSELLEPLSKIDDTSVRIVSSEDIKGYTLLNVSLMVIEQAENLKDVLMTTKFTCPILFVGDIFTDVTVRSEGYDFIKTPVNETELIIRAKALLKIKQYKDKMEEISVTDELTGLHNRKYLQERLESEISRARRYKTQLSCLLFDIDFFKVINDMYGYEWGDILLRNLSGKLQQLIRKEDILTRYGDEEFLVVLPNTSEDNAFLFAERFRRDIERMEFIPAGEEERHPITISGGIATYPCMENVDEDANTIIRYAEHALYNAKKRGKNKIVQFTQINLEF